MKWWVNTCCVVTYKLNISRKLNVSICSKSFFQIQTHLDSTCLHTTYRKTQFCSAYVIKITQNDLLLLPINKFTVAKTIFLLLSYDKMQVKFKIKRLG